jgi:hypothetical protein
VATDKFIDRTYAEQLKGWISMTKVGQLFEEEKMDALNQLLQEEQRKREELQQEEQGKRITMINGIVKKMILDGEDILKIMKYSELPKSEILKIQQSM